MYHIATVSESHQMTHSPDRASIVCHEKFIKLHEMRYRVGGGGGGGNLDLYANTIGSNQLMLLLLSGS